MDATGTANVINGKELARELTEELKDEEKPLSKKTGIPRGLPVVLVGVAPASKVYVRNKTLACEKAGIRSFKRELPANGPTERLLGIIEELNASKEVHGILVQLPLPPQIDEQAVIEAIDPGKDVDGFHPYNMGRLMTGNPLLTPCTPPGIMRMLHSAGIEVSGKEAVIVGRSNIVGKPMAMMLLKRNATVTVCHSKTQDLPGHVRSADIVVAAVGRPAFVKGDWIKKGAAVIDVGVNRTKDGRLTGDVDFIEASRRASFITTVPGGVGPMTIAMLLKNTVEAAKRT